MLRPLESVGLRGHTRHAARADARGLLGRRPFRNRWRRWSDEQWWHRRQRWSGRAEQQMPECDPYAGGPVQWRRKLRLSGLCGARSRVSGLQRIDDLRPANVCMHGHAVWGHIVPSRNDLRVRVLRCCLDDHALRERSVRHRSDGLRLRLLCAAVFSGIDVLLDGRWRPARSGLPGALSSSTVPTAAARRSRFGVATLRR